MNQQAQYTCARCNNYFFSSEAQPKCTHCGNIHDFAKKKGATQVMSQDGSRLESALAPEKVRQFGRYDILGELGRGGMGVVFKAYDTQLKRTVALKLLLPGEEASETDIGRFLRESKATAKLEHPNIIKLYDAGMEEGRPFFTMDYIEGDSLKEQAKKSLLSIRQLVDVMIKVGNAIHCAHNEGVVHRDLKPTNIMMDSNGEPRVMDFGLAKMAKTSKKLSKTGMIIGTLQYMPPEQAQGLLAAIDERSDVYSLGAILYQLLTKRPPFSGGSTFSILIQILQKDPIPPTQIKKRVPKELEVICLKALAKDKKDRYQSALAMVRDLERFSRGESIQARSGGFGKKIFRGDYKIPFVICFLVLIFALGMVFQKQKNVEKIQSVLMELRKEAKKEKESAQSLQRMKEIVIEIEKDIPLEVKREYVLECIRMPGKKVTEKLISWLKSGDKKKLFAIEVLGKRRDLKAKVRGKNTIEHLVENLRKEEMNKNLSHIEATIWALGRLKAKKSFSQISKLYQSLPLIHPLRKNTLFPFNLIAKAARENPAVSAQYLSLNERDNSFLLMKKGRDNLRIELSVNYTQRGYIINSVGIEGAPRGATSLQISDNSVVFSVYHPESDSPFRGNNGWNNLEVKRAMPPEVDHHIVLEVENGNYTLIVDKHFRQSMSLSIPLAELPLFIGDYPDDNERFNSEQRWNTFRGLVEVLYVGNIHEQSYRE